MMIHVRSNGFPRVLVILGFGVFLPMVLPVAAFSDSPEHNELLAMPGFEEFGMLVDWRNDVDQTSLPPDTLMPPDTPAPRSTPQTDTFVSASGRALMYRYAIPDGVNVSEPQPVLIHFHGNNSGSQEHMLDIWFNSTSSIAEERGLIPVVVASPETRNPPQEEVRQWMSEDRQLVHEFLQNGLTTHLTVDHERIYFDGGSQGACFLHDFMQSHGEHYGGGFYGGCGCYNSPDPTWDPPEAFKERMKVYIHNTTGDFLFEAGNRGYAYYKYTIGLDTRGDLDQDGPHCALNSQQRRVALDWFTGVNEIPEEPFRPHWSRISTQENIVGLAVDGGERVWKLVDQPESEHALLYRQANPGQGWLQAAEVQGQPTGFGGFGQNLFMIMDESLRHTSDGGQTFVTIDPEVRVNSIAVDSEGVIYRRGYNLGLYWSSNLGSSWQSLGGFYWLSMHHDAIMSISDPRIIANNSQSDLFLSNTKRDGLIALQDTPSGRAASASWDGAELWSIPQTGSLQVFRSSDEGQSWQKVTLSDAMAGYSRWWGTRITALGSGKVLVHGGYLSAWLSEDHGESWQRVHGLETGYGGAVSAQGEAILFTDGQAAFRLNLTEFPNRIFRDAFE